MKNKFGYNMFVKILFLIKRSVLRWILIIKEIKYFIFVVKTLLQLK